jgi:molybdate/tungstate transport system substrate-binding protein
MRMLPIRIPGAGRLGLLVPLLLSAVPAAAQQRQVVLQGQLVVFNAGSLAAPFRELLREFRRLHPRVIPRQESSGSLEAARKITDLGRIPDVIGVADSLVIPSLLIPAHATWYATFARNAMTLIYSDRSIGAREVNGQNWWSVLQRQGVRVGRSDPSLDPSGYRSLMVVQLAEQHYGQQGLADKLMKAMPQRYMRPKEADLVAMVQAGELDYAWSYQSIAIANGLPMVDLPREINLSDPMLSPRYSQVSVPIRTADGTMDIPGAPIIYALTIPSRAVHRALATEFVRFVFSPEGQEILNRHGFIPMERPIVGGTARPPAGLIPGN